MLSCPSCSTLLPSTRVRDRLVTLTLLFCSALAWGANCDKIATRKRVRMAAAPLTAPRVRAGREAAPVDIVFMGSPDS